MEVMEASIAIKNYKRVVGDPPKSNSFQYGSRSGVVTDAHAKQEHVFHFSRLGHRLYASNLKIVRAADNPRLLQFRHRLCPPCPGTNDGRDGALHDSDRFGLPCLAEKSKYAPLVGNRQEDPAGPTPGSTRAAAHAQ